MTGSILYVSILSLALNRCASGLLPGRPLKIGGGNFTLGGQGAGPPGPGVGIQAAATYMAATIWANKVAPAGGGPAGPTSPAGPTGLVWVVMGTLLHLLHLLLHLLCLWVMGWVQPFQKPNVTIN